MKDNLPIGVIWADVEHIGISIRMGCHIDEGGSRGTPAEKGQRIREFRQALSAQTGKRTVKPNENQDKMPYEAMEC